MSRSHARPGLWVAAALAAAALHAGVAGASLLLLGSADGDDEAGALAQQVALEIVAPRSDETEDLPVGPASDASSEAAASMAAQQDSKPKSEAETPDAVAADEAPAAKKDEAQRDVSAQSAASAASQAAEATAPPPNPQSESTASTSSAPVIGRDPAAERARANWLRKLAAHMERNKRYPPGETATGEVRVAFRLTNEGRIQDAHIVTGSGKTGLDAAALDMLRRADPAPPPPTSARGPIDFEMPIVFKRQTARR